LAELQHPNTVPHFVSLATDQLASEWGGGKRYEWSGIRLVATKGLLLMRDKADAYVRTHRPQLASVIDAWWTAYERSELQPLIAELKKNDGATSPIAAFALGMFDTDAARAELVAVFADDHADREVAWAVADTLATLDPAWVATTVIAPRLKQFVDPRVAYLIGRTGMAGHDPRQWDYLKQCLRHGNFAVQARAIAALGGLKDPDARELCEAIVADDWDRARQLGLTFPSRPEGEDLGRFRNSSLEALRNVGTLADTLRKARQGSELNVTLRQLSFDVAEDIYWQATGGLSKESFDPSTTR
jgi:hypothetical protein